MFQSEPGVIKVLRPKNSVAGISLLKRRAWYEGDPAPDPAPNPAPSPASGTGGSDMGKTFTQDDLNRIVGERAARAKEAAIADLLKELGMDNADTLKAKVKAQADAEAAQLSELDKANKKAADLEAKLKEAQDSAAKATQERMEERRNTAILTALTAGGSKKAQSVLNLLIAEHAADVQAAMGDDGTLDSKKVEALVTLAKKEYDGLFGTTNPGSQSHSGGKNPTPDSKLKDEIRKQIRVRY